MGGQHGAEADARHVEEWLIIDDAEVDCAALRGGDDVHGSFDLPRYAQGAGEIIGRAERHDSQRQARLAKTFGAGVQCSVSAGDDDAIDILGKFDDRRGNVPAPVDLGDDQVESALAQMIFDGLRHLRGAPGVPVENEKGVAARLEGRVHEVLSNHLKGKGAWPCDFLQ